MGALFRTAGTAALAFAGSAAAQQPPLPFRFERASEDWSALTNPQARTRPWHRLKAIPLGRNGLLTLGADLQVRAEVQDPPFFGIAGDFKDDYVLVRTLAHASVRPNRHVRAFAEIGHHDGLGRRLPFPLDDNRFDLTQAFLELNGEAGGAKLTARAGRQEMTLSPRYYASRAGVNTRQRYEGVRAWAERGPWRADAFAVSPLIDRKASFDDESDDAVRLYGARAARSYGPDRASRVTVNLYQQERDGVSFAGRTGDERRLSLGGRLQGAAGGWDWDGEGYLQVGEFAGLEVEAWSFSADLGRRFTEAPLRPRVGLRALGGSGDADPRDGELNTFLGQVVRPLCCADPLFLLPSNVIAVAPVAEVQLTPKLTLEALASTYWRQEPADALYTYPQTPYPRTAGRAGDDLVSVAPQLTLTWQPTAEITVQAAAVHQSTEGPLAAAGARDARYAFLSLSVRL